ncbi:hypothetical protein GOP47_0024349 [Adiantum capillus-veneris]|uniref:PRONE domain-containing protein n=1 Tax=Adiantum capillus-veneris TaxID=13818 RepID=A0A9D4U1Q4_ADICA|nr:hypothetical protein GOP47_0024349 [Adiantum capillus-veneris]
MERQQSASSSISLNSWGSDLAEEKEEYHVNYSGFNFNCQIPNEEGIYNKSHAVHRKENLQVGHATKYKEEEPHMLLEPDLLLTKRTHFARPSPSDSLELLLSKRLALSHHDKEWSSLILMMKERFAKLLLGEDFSGGSKASNTALTISNAITKLSVAIFGDLWRLEPLPCESKLKWQREMEWLVSPCDYIVELVPSTHPLEDGTTVEVLASKPRSDVYIDVPALQKLDALLLGTLESFSETEFWYAESVQENPSSEMACDFQDCKAWIPVAKVPCCGLSGKARKQLSHQREAASQILKAAKSINEHVLSEMDIPESYWKALPKSSKKVIGDTPLKIITSEFCCFETLLSTMDCPSYRTLLNLANGLETLIHVWKSKISSRLKQALHPEGMACRATPTWGLSRDSSLKKVEKKKIYVRRAENLLMELRQRFPGVLQTSLELIKVQLNKDVGYAVLESYSRVLVNLAARIQARIGEVITADKDAMLSRLHSLKANPDACQGTAEAEGPMTSPGPSYMEPVNYEAHRRYSMDCLTHLGVQLERALGDLRLTILQKPPSETRFSC